MYGGIVGRTNYAVNFSKDYMTHFEVTSPARLIIHLQKSLNVFGRFGHI